MSSRHDDRDRDRHRSDDRRDRDRYDDRDRYKESSSRQKDRGGDRDRDRSRSRSRERTRDKDKNKGKDRERERGSKRRERSESRERDRDREKKKKRKSYTSRSPSPHTKRKLEKKALKASTRREAELLAARQVAELSMYTSTDNPFHDSNLTSQFKWVKKREKEKKAGIGDEEAARRDQVRRLEAKEELERLNRRRGEREVEMQLREEEDARLARMAESAQMADWVAKEDDFHLEQSRRRAGIRLRENRAKAIDFLAINLRFADPNGGYTRSKLQEGDDEDAWGWEDAGLDWDIDEPWLIFENLTVGDMEELEGDIKMYLSLEKSPINIEFWECMQIICQSHLHLRSSSLNPTLNATQGRSTNAAVEGDITRLLEGKTHEQLIGLERNVRQKLGRAGRGEAVDVDYWEGLLRSLEVWKAKAKLHQIHLVVIQNRLEQLRHRQREQALKVQEELGGRLTSTSGPNSNRPNPSMDAAALARQAAEQAAEEMDIEMDEEGGLDGDGEGEGEVVGEEYAREMSPELVEGGRLAQEDRNLPILDEEEEYRSLFAARRTITANNFIPRANARTTTTLDPSTSASNANAASFADLAAERMYREEAAKNLDEDEEFFNLEEGLFNPGTYSWEDRYRPRKPRFFNRVHTGFEWNKYNQTHYDTDNPPPKVVQGYKFNIFYPDLIDKTKTPSYHFKRDKNDPDTSLLIFTAGPPYEDIAFRIVDKEWEYSHKRGFRSSFDRGVLQLYFNFKRQFYRK